MYEFGKKTDEDLLYSALCSVRINETNNIYVYMGTFKKNHECDIEHGALEFMAYQDGYEIEIPIKECESFEQNHIVIYPQGTCLCDQYYLKLRDEFFDTAILDSQEKALEKIMTLKK